MTQEQYEKVIGNNPSWFKSEGGGKDKVEKLDTAEFPVETVTWADADGFCQALGKKVKWGKLSRLPWEAEWEYACRAGTETPFWFGDVCNGKQANCDGNYPYGTETRGRYLGRTCQVGGDKEKRYKANAFGLYDMHGNVCQWCLDYYGSYDGLNNEDPVQLNKGTENRRVLRGGSWSNYGGFCRAAYRLKYDPAYIGSNVGFRVCVRLN